jgi:anaerobic selenocysteine-containing dehydrogenase
MVQTTTCPLCEASRGILVDTEGEQIRSIRGDENDPFSLSYVCPKATALADLHNERLAHRTRQP